MELPTALCLPTTDTGTHSVEQTEEAQHKDVPGGPMLEQCSMTSTDPRVAVRHTSPSPIRGGRASQCSHGTPCQQCRSSSTDSMAIMQEATGITIPLSTFSLLEKGWRGSTRKQYQSVWPEWGKWYTDQRLDTASVSVEKLLSYLQYLYNKGLARRSLNVHRSAISSILEVHKPVPTGNHPLVCWFLKGSFNQRAALIQMLPT